MVFQPSHRRNKLEPPIAHPTIPPSSRWRRLEAGGQAWLRRQAGKRRMQRGLEWWENGMRKLDGMVVYHQHTINIPSTWDLMGFNGI